MKALVVLFAFVLISKGAIGQQSYFPILVSQWATARGCAAIPEWYNQEDIFDPPYVMGWLPGNREESAAYWCVSKNNSRKVRLIFEGERVSAQRKLSGTLIVYLGFLLSTSGSP